MMTFGLLALSFSLFHMTNFTLGVDFRTVVYARMIQTMGLAFLFIPINTAAYAFLPKEKNNAASGLMNLARNIGGSVGISIVTTMLDRRSQYHMSRMSSHFRLPVRRYRRCFRARLRPCRREAFRLRKPCTRPMG